MSFNVPNEPDNTAYSALDTLSLMCDTTIVKYEIETTNIFDKWFSKIKDINKAKAILAELE